MIATLEGHTVTHGRVWVPRFGLPWAEVSLDVEATLTGSVSLTVADTTWRMAVVAGGANVGRSHYRLVGGAGGWGRDVAEKGYANDAGVKVSTVLGDAAAEVGETFAATLPTTRIGPAYARERGPAARVLEHVAPGAWYVREDGSTVLGLRAASSLATAYTVGAVDLARGTATLAAEQIAGIVPGLVVEGLTVADVLHEVTPGALRSHVWGESAAGETRRVEAIRAIVAQLFPDMRYRGVYEYRVVTQSGERLDVQPVRTGLGLPSLRRVPVRHGIPGAKASHLLGSRVLVSFVDADPARPVVVGFEEPDGPGALAVLLTLQGGTKGIARKDDAVRAGRLLVDGGILYYRETLTDAWAPIAAPLNPGVQALSDLGTPLIGDITAASSLARCG